MLVNLLKPDPEHPDYTSGLSESSDLITCSLSDSANSTSKISPESGANAYSVRSLDSPTTTSLTEKPYTSVSCSDSPSSSSIMCGNKESVVSLVNTNPPSSCRRTICGHADALETIRSHIQAYTIHGVQPGANGLNECKTSTEKQPASSTKSDNAISSTPTTNAYTWTSLLASNSITSPLGSRRPNVDTTVTPPSICVICEDKASGRHYGVMSCEGCKGFFKRTVRKQTQYVCRGNGDCPVDRRKRTRCQACRYNRCILKGMKREAVQEERQRCHLASLKPAPKASNTDVKHSTPCVEHTTGEESTSPAFSIPPISFSSDNSTEASTDPISRPPPPPVTTNTVTCLPELTLPGLLAAELSTDSDLPTTEAGESVYIDIGEDSTDPLVVICQSVEEQLHRLLGWARQLPCFSVPYLSIDDQFWLLKSAWPELLLVSAAFNSVVVSDGLLLSNGRHLSRSTARLHGLGPLMDRFLAELVSRFRELGLERVELALLRAIILFNPDANNLTARDRVESIRESLYAGLHSYCTTSHATDMSRFTKLLLRLPPLRSIAQKCLEHLVFVKIAAEDPTSRHLINLVEHGVWPSNEQSFEFQK